MSSPTPASGASVRKNTTIALTIVPLSLALFVYQRALVPLYASGPTNYLFNPFIGLGAALAALNPVPFSTSWSWLLTALVLSAAPNTNYWVAVWTARYGNAIAGAAATHAIVLLPLVFLFTTTVMLDPRDEKPSSSPKAQPYVKAPIGHRISRAVVIYLIGTGLARDLWPAISALNAISESKIYLGLASVFYLLWILTTPLLVPSSDTKGKSKKAKVSPSKSNTSSWTNRLVAAAGFVAFWAISHTFLENPVLPHPLKTPYTSPDGSFRVLSAVQSVTGLITVVDWLPPAVKSQADQMHSVRYLRASHSLLGGVWTHEKVMVTDSSEVALEDSFGEPLGDSIYATFVLQEAVRMVNSTTKAGKLDNALVIGLGIGTSTTSLMRHGISTTIVEIDPAVYNAARTYFALPDPGAGKVHLEDARGWVEKQKECVKSGQCTRFDTIIHDCFSGGGVPEHLFTTEFWASLKTILDPEGVLVLNFAGIVNSESTRLVLNTLLTSFNQCRAFHDYFDEFTDEIYNKEFINMVLFCTSSEKPLTFRNAKNSDYLGSPLRQHVLSSLDAREVDLEPLIDATGNYIVTDSNNPLGRLQDAQGSHHWEVMRTVLPVAQWETY